MSRCARRVLGGLVPATDGSFRIDYLQPAANGQSLRLAKVPSTGAVLKQGRTIASGTALDGGYPFRPYLAAHGSGQLLEGRRSLEDRGGRCSHRRPRRGPVTTSLKIDNFQDMVTAPTATCCGPAAAAAARCM